MRTAREQRALVALTDAVAEVTSLLGDPRTDSAHRVQVSYGSETAEARALSKLYRANEAWQAARVKAGMARLKRQHALATTGKGEVLECVLSREQLKKMARGKH